MNIFAQESELVTAKTCGCKDKKSVTYSFSEKFHGLCLENKTVIESEIQACKKIVKVRTRGLEDACSRKDSLSQVHPPHTKFLKPGTWKILNACNNTFLELEHLIFHHDGKEYIVYDVLRADEITAMIRMDQERDRKLNPLNAKSARKYLEDTDKMVAATLRRCFRMTDRQIADIEQTERRNLASSFFRFLKSANCLWRGSTAGKCAWLQSPWLKAPL